MFHTLYYSWHSNMALKSTNSFCHHVFEISYHLFAQILLLHHITKPPPPMSLNSTSPLTFQVHLYAQHICWWHCSYLWPLMSFQKCTSKGTQVSITIAHSKNMLVIVRAVVHMDWQPKYQSTSGCNVHKIELFVFSLKAVAKILHGKSTSHTRGWSTWKG